MAISPDITTCSGCTKKHFTGARENFTDVPYPYSVGLKGKLCELCLQVVRDAGYNPTILTNLSTLLTGMNIPVTRKHN